MSILRYENVEWSVPFLFGNRRFYEYLRVFFSEIDLDCPVKSVYGHIKNKWNGWEFGVERFQNVGEELESATRLGMTPTINFSNYHIEESDLKDSYCNQMLDYGVSIKAKFIISSDLLYDYIKGKYPQARLVSSDIKALYELEKGKEVEFYKNLYDKYEMITLSPHYVKEGFLTDVEKYGDISKFEVVVNNTCLVNCDKFKEHNESVEKFETGKEGYVNYYQLCPRNSMDIKEGISKTLVLSREELDNIVGVGISKLKLNGFSFQPMLFPELISSYIFNPYSDYQHCGFKLDEAIS